MSDTTFSSGTTIASAWLNDVNKKTYRESISALSLCTGNGVTDETTLLQQVFDLVPVGGAIVYLPTGYTFLVSDTIVVKSNTKVTGGGTIKLADGSDTHLLENENYASGSNQNIVLEGIILDGNQINQSAYAGTYNTHVVHMQTVSSLTIKDCEIKNAGVDCVNLTDCEFVKILYNHLWGARNHAVTFQNTPGLQGIGNRIHDCGSKTDAYGITSSGHAFIGVNVACDDVVLANNYIYDMGDSCLRNERAAQGWIIANNLVVNSGKDSIKIMGYAGLSATPTANVISGNVVIDAGNDGIFVTGKCVVTGNYVFGSGKNTAGAASDKWFTSASCIKTFFNSTAQTYQPKITGNFCQDGLYAGIYIGGVDWAEATGNTCYLNGVAGIAVIDCAEGVVVTNNVCTDNGTATVGSGFGIRCSLFSASLQENFIIKNNVCGNTTTANQGYGIYLSGTTTNNVTVKYNSFMGNVVVAFLNSSGAGSGVVVAFNEGYVTENRGTATVLNGTTSILVNHGLAVTPTSSQVSITPTNSMGSATKFWLSSVTSSQIQISVDANPGATTATFAWKIN